jgi:hypothetical protein
MPQSAQHKAKISRGVKAYHACARSKGCGKGANKSLTAVKKKAKEDSKAKKKQLDKMKADAKKKLQQRLKERAKAKKKPVKKPVKKPEKKPRKRVFAKRRNKKEMEETRRMMMEDKNVNKIPVKKPAKKPVKKKPKTPFNKAKEFLWMRVILDSEAEDIYTEYIWDNLRSKKEREAWEEDGTLDEFSDKRVNQLRNGLKKFVEAKAKKEYDKLTGKSDKEIRKILMMKFMGEEMDDDELKEYNLFIF